MAGFSFYGNTSSSAHKHKKYVAGIEENLRLLRSEYGESWSMRLYYDLPRTDRLMEQLCDLACTNNNLDLCHVRHLPGCGQLDLTDASQIFAMLWRFLPCVDPQVEVMVSRDLDSRISAREVSAVEEWLESGLQVHAMRDHPAHNTAMLGGMWGARMTEESRPRWVETWREMVRDGLSLASRERKGPDQQLLTKWVWPWARAVAL